MTTFCCSGRHVREMWCESCIITCYAGHGWAAKNRPKRPRNWASTQRNGCVCDECGSTVRPDSTPDASGCEGCYTMFVHMLPSRYGHVSEGIEDVCQLCGEPGLCHSYQPPWAGCNGRVNAAYRAAYREDPKATMARRWSK